MSFFKNEKERERERERERRGINASLNRANKSSIHISSNQMAHSKESDAISESMRTERGMSRGSSGGCGQSPDSAKK